MAKIQHWLVLLAILYLGLLLSFLDIKSNKTLLPLGICAFFKPRSGGTSVITSEGNLNNYILAQQLHSSMVFQGVQTRREGTIDCLRFSCPSLCTTALVLLKDVMSSLDVGVKALTEAKKKLLFSSKMSICPVATLLLFSISPFFLLCTFLHC